MIQQINGLGRVCRGRTLLRFSLYVSLWNNYTTGCLKFKAGARLMFSSQLGIMRMPHSLILFSLPADGLIGPPGAKLAPLTYVQAACRR